MIRSNSVAAGRNIDVGRCQLAASSTLSLRRAFFEPTGRTRVIIAKARHYGGPANSVCSRHALLRCDDGLVGRAHADDGVHADDDLHRLARD